MKSIRIGVGGGTANDSTEPAIVLLEQGNLDYLFFECLAERTIAFAMLDKKKDPSKGYDAQLEFRMGKILDSYRRVNSKTKIISNMGAANPIGAAKRIVELCRERGLANLKVAAVTGDDVFDKVDKFKDRQSFENGQKLVDYMETIVNANAYIGCKGIVEALKNGADIVITGRVADPALTVGPCVYEFGWELDDWHHLGCATIAGHLLECGGQITGGYYADCDRKIVPDLWNLGFPFGIVYENGDVEISKIEGTGGLVNEMVVKEQALYELYDPANYLTPDVIADFTGVRLTQTGPDRVYVTGGTGKKKTGQLKVQVGYHDCFIGEGEISYGGYKCVDRARLAGDCVIKRLEQRGIEYSEIRVDLIGVNSLYRDEISTGMCIGDPAEVRLRVAARTTDQFSAERVAYEVEALFVAGPAGGGGARRNVREIISIMSIFISEDEVTQTVDYYGGE